MRSSKHVVGSLNRSVNNGIVNGLMVPRATRTRTAFTLVEVLLALALSAVILLMIGGAIRLHLNMLDTRRSGIEEAELARAILRQIRTDLESATLLGEATSTGQLENASDTDPDEDPNTDTDADADADTDATDDEDVVDIENETTVGLYGTLNSIRFEASRMTREMNQTLIDPSLQDPNVPRSGLQTVGYFLGSPFGTGANPQQTGGTGLSGTFGSEPGGGGLNQPFSAGGVGGGGLMMSLMRLTMDHTVHTRIVENGGASSAQLYAQEMAPEVTYLTFRYFDGLQWLEQWDSTVQGGLPIAVEVTVQLGVTPTNNQQNVNPGAIQQTSVSSVARGVVPDGLYQMIVQLPVGIRTYDQEEEDTSG